MTFKIVLKKNLSKKYNHLVNKLHKFCKTEPKSFNCVEDECNHKLKVIKLVNQIKEEYRN